MLFVFFIKQKTAYEMRISDWSSDVCSSDLFGMVIMAYKLRDIDPIGQRGRVKEDAAACPICRPSRSWTMTRPFAKPWATSDGLGARSEESRVGKECVSTCSSRRSPYH